MRKLRHVNQIVGYAHYLDETKIKHNENYLLYGIHYFVTTRHAHIYNT